jgi:hypothetical protein
MQTEHSMPGATERKREDASLLNEVRAGFVRQGRSLHRWCQENGVAHSNARDCLLGVWNGPAATALRSRLIAAALAGATDV